jgi:hypothetical protein
MVGSPSACHARSVSVTSAASSAGSSEKGESTPPSLRSRVTCFSIRHAPNATDATGTPMPSVWSDSPTSVPNACASTGSARRLLSFGDAG